MFVDACRAAATLKRYAGERNQRRLTVSGLAHLKAVERLVPQLNKLRGLERIDHLSACVEVKA
jgi:hypothetical protein